MNHRISNLLSFTAYILFYTAIDYQAPPVVSA